MLEQNALGTDVVSKNASCKKALGSGVIKQLQEPKLNRNAGKQIWATNVTKKVLGTYFFLITGMFSKSFGNRCQK